MTDYSSIKGNRIQYLDSDPTLSSTNEGQVWYNNATGALKGLVQIKAWSSGANVPINIRNHMGTGPSTAGVLFGGFSPPITAITTALEYSGYSYSTGGTINTPSRSLAGSGASQTSALKIMGQTEPFSVDVGITNTESYDGSTWTTVNPANTKRFQIGGSGTQTSSIVLGGRDDPADRGTSFEEYDGTSWATGTSPPLSKSNTGVWGNSTAALVFGGNTPAVPPGTTQNTTQDWNGTAWTSVSDMINRAYNNASNCGDSGSGVNANSTGSEEWDGQIWSTIPAMTSARNGCGGGDNSNIWIGGSPPGFNLTEEYNSNIQAITKAVWASGGNTNTSRYELGGTGILTAGLIAGGYLGPPGNTGAVEEYNGTSWSNQTSLNTSRRNLKGFGIQTAGTMAGGYTTGTSAATENYNGTSWTNTGNLNTGRYGATATGTQTTGLIFGGSGGPRASEEFNGSTWTTGNSTNTGDRRGAAGGSQTATIYANRETSSAASTNVENYDGTSWTTGTSTNIARVYNSGTGVQDDFLTIGGSPNTSSSEIWDGTTWSQNASLATGRGASGSGTATSSTASGFVAAGDGSPTHTNATEEYTGGTQTTTASTITTS